MLTKTASSAKLRLRTVGSLVRKDGGDEMSRLGFT